MALTYAILSVLADRPQSKDDIIKYFESSIGLFWKASHLQIDGGIVKLHHRGWIERSDCQLYRLSVAGTQELIEWINEPCESLSYLDRMLANLLLDSSNNLVKIHQDLLFHQRLHLEKLLVLHTIKEQSFPELQEFLSSNTLSFPPLQSGILHEQRWIDWCDKSLARVEYIIALNNQQALASDRP